MTSRHRTPAEIAHDRAVAQLVENTIHGVSRRMRDERQRAEETASIRGAIAALEHVQHSDAAKTAAALSFTNAGPRINGDT